MHQRDRNGGGIGGLWRSSYMVACGGIGGINAAAGGGRPPQPAERGAGSFSFLNQKKRNKSSLKQMYKKGKCNKSNIKVSFVEIFMFTINNRYLTYICLFL